jgi:hypothetical protein
VDDLSERLDWTPVRLPSHFSVIVGEDVEQTKRKRLVEMLRAIEGQVLYGDFLEVYGVDIHCRELPDDRWEWFALILGDKGIHDPPQPTY